MKKFLSLVLTAILTVSLSLFCFAEEEVVGTDITAAVTMNFTVGEGKSAFLRDRNLESACSARDRFELLIASETPIYGIYLIWNTRPASWKLTGNTEIVSGGSEGYLHEYAPLSGGTAYTLTWEGPSDAQLAEIYFLSEGSVPEFVQVWDESYTKADILMLPVLAGDEFFYFGGTLPYYGAELGLQVQVAYLLNADATRNHELLNALWYAGVRNYPVFSNFSSETSYTEDEILAFMVEILRRFKPEVVLGPDLAGNGGDPVRMQFASVLSQQALTAARDASQYTDTVTEYGVWQVKKCYLHLYGEGNVFLDWSAKNLTSFDGMTAFEAAQTAFGYHVSQQDKGLMSPDDPLRGGNGLFGLYSTTVGDDAVKQDFLENIPAESLSDWVEPEPEPEPELPTTEDDSHTETQDTTVTVPQVAVPQPKPSNKSDFPPFLLWTIVAFGAVSLIGTVVLICKSGKRK